MKLTPDCVPCLMKRVLFQARLLENGCESEAVGAALRAYAKEYATRLLSIDVNIKIDEMLV